MDTPALLVAAVLLPTLAGAVVAGSVRLLRRWQARAGAGALPAGPPLGRLAADLRRLHARLAAFELEPPGPGRAVRLQALRGAYRDALSAACQALDVAAPPAPGRAGVQEIYRVEAALRAKGLDVRTPAGRPDAAG